MILITGGAYQGKAIFAGELARQEVEAGKDRTEVVTNLHEIIADAMREEKDPYALVSEMTEENPDLIITVNELGCGIVPMDAFDREWRETTGRISCRLAKKAERVYRVTCGIAMEIKAEQNGATGSMTV
ncbi:MAG: bifunctional adenosylcobinamide kinase/adenosylcobinamide-phosphate guanylyltransferase [Clostridiales bacterium]|nr:bifunctional adenosylcobinamide kinase/adenosylcobinamide-phosphate guanylyltransferase [Clostridiales bacterium]